MSTIERLANDKSLKELFTEYLTCSLYLEQARTGVRSVSKHIHDSLHKRLADVKARMVKAARKLPRLRNEPEQAIEQAAQLVLRQHPAGPAYFLSRLPLR